jgi:hypothetical protein
MANNSTRNNTQIKKLNFEVAVEEEEIGNGGFELQTKTVPQFWHMALRAVITAKR